MYVSAPYIDPMLLNHPAFHGIRHRPGNPDVQAALAADAAACRSGGTAAKGTEAAGAGGSARAGGGQRGSGQAIWI